MLTSYNLDILHSSEVPAPNTGFPDKIVCAKCNKKFSDSDKGVKSYIKHYQQKHIGIIVKTASKFLEFRVN